LKVLYGCAVALVILAIIMFVYGLLFMGDTLTLR
jgi:hypothetical protein